MHAVEVTSEWKDEAVRDPILGTVYRHRRKRVYRVVIQLTRSPTSRFVSRHEYNSWESASKAAERIRASGNGGKS